MALHIYIDTIPHRQHRYPTVGDYWRPATQRTGSPERLEVRVSDMGNEDYEFLVAIHELIEEHLTRKHGISEEAITAFDVAFEATRTPDDNSEPGDALEAPYRSEHQYATYIEKQLAYALGVNWFEYGEAIDNLFKSSFSPLSALSSSDSVENAIKAESDYSN